MNSIHTQIEEARRLTGAGLFDIRRGMELWPTKNPWLGALYMVAKTHAVNIKGNRDERDRTWAVSEYLRQKAVDSL